MKLAVPKEKKFKANRVALIPYIIKYLVKKGSAVTAETGGLNSYFAAGVYTATGAQQVKITAMRILYPLQAEHKFVLK